MMTVHSTSLLNKRPAILQQNDDCFAKVSSAAFSKRPDGCRQRLRLGGCHPSRPSALFRKVEKWLGGYP
eukprot:718982-Pyramimonas_sp.AAC.2